MPTDIITDIEQINSGIDNNVKSCEVADAELDFYAKKSSSDAELQLLAIRNALEHERLQNEQQNRADRRKYANRIYWLMVCWISSIMLTVLVNGLGDCIYFHVSDKVLITLISGTTINVLGVFVIVAKYLFNHGPKFKGKESKQK